jgi:hypothetical protein
MSRESTAKPLLISFSGLALKRGEDEAKAVRLLASGSEDFRSCRQS